MLFNNHYRLLPFLPLSLSSHDLSDLYTHSPRNIILGHVFSVKEFGHRECLASARGRLGWNWLSQRPQQETIHKMQADDGIFCPKE